MVYQKAAMEVVQADGGVNVNFGDDIKMTENTAMTEASEKIRNSGFDSRDRRKSKYLSYPYTSIESRKKGLPAETEDLKTPCLSHKEKVSSKATNPLNGSPSFSKSGSKRFRRNWYRKFISSSTMSSSPEFINASPAELLSGLYSKAVDCMFPIENKSFDLVEWFFCRYRVAEYHDEAELATSLVNAEGGNIVKSVGNDLLDIKTKKKRRKNNGMENIVRRKMKSLSGLSDVNISTPTGDSLRLGRKLKQKRKVDEVTSLHQLENVDTTLNESSSKHSSVNEVPQNLRCVASEGKAEPKKRKKIETAREHQSTQFTSAYTDAKSTKCSSLVIDLQPISPLIPGDIPDKSNGENTEELVGSNPELCVSQGLVGNITNHSLFVSTTSEVGTISVNETGVKNIMEKAAEEHLNTKLDTEIPDLNGTSFESNSIRKECENVNLLSPEVESEQPRSLSARERHTKTVNNNGMEDNGESLGTCLFLRFAPGVYVPSKEDLLKTFCPFGPLKASETRLLKDTGSAQVVFVRSADAGEAFRSLEQNQPFGATLVDYKLHHPPAATSPAERFGTATQPTRFMPLPGESPPPLPSKASETQLLKDTGSAQVVFVRSADAGQAFQRLEQNKPFGATLVDYKLHHPPAATSPGERFGTPTQPTRFMPLPGEAPPLPLKASETQLLKDTGSAQVVFVRSADAGQAFQSLEQNKPFGATLVDYKLHHPSAATSPGERFGTPTPPTRFMPLPGESPPPLPLKADTGSSQVVFVRSADAGEAFRSSEQNKPFGATLVDYKPDHTPAATSPAERFGTPTQPTMFMPLPGEAPPPLHFIKQNLQMMTSMLENSGSNLSPQTRAKLDSEIKNLMKKVNSRTCSSPPKSKQ